LNTLITRIQHGHDAYNEKSKKQNRLEALDGLRWCKDTCATAEEQFSSTISAAFVFVFFAFLNLSGNKDTCATAEEEFSSMISADFVFVFFAFLNLSGMACDF
jgi:hypothetical protein